MSKPVIGFIGLGLMGGNMVENLQTRGYDDIVMLCVTTSEVVESLIYGDDGILAGIKEGAVVIDFGTSIPESTRKIGADLAAKGAGMIDAPLGRTPAHAKDGLLNIMAAGDQATFDKVKPVLDDQGENVFYLGALGAGHVTKLINNFMGMTTVCAMSQAFDYVGGSVEFALHGICKEIRGGRDQRSWVFTEQRKQGFGLLPRDGQRHGHAR